MMHAASLESPPSPLCFPRIALAHVPPPLPGRPGRSPSALSFRGGRVHAGSLSRGQITSRGTPS